jgi:peptide deformylase
MKQLLVLDKGLEVWIPGVLPQASELTPATEENVSRNWSLIEALRTYLINRKHGAIALPQVGINIKAVMAVKEWKNNVTATLLLNPTYVPDPHASVVYCSETCMSLGKLPMAVPRTTKCTVQYGSMLTGPVNRVILLGREAFAIQHVIDHANGTYWGGSATHEKTLVA